VWWVKLGITHERIEPGRPDQNGRHERMHKTLKQETTDPAEECLVDQQHRFDRWRDEFNEVRPHEALGQVPPAHHYQPSPRTYPKQLPEVTYPEGFVVRRVRQAGEIKWHSRLIYVSSSLVGEPVGLKRLDETRWRVYFSHQPIGILDEQLNRVLPMSPV